MSLLKLYENFEKILKIGNFQKIPAKMPQKQTILSLFIPNHYMDTQNLESKRMGLLSHGHVSVCKQLKQMGNTF